MRLIPAVLFSLTLILTIPFAQIVSAKVPLSQVAVIDDSLMEIAIADEIRKTCGGISARMFRALGRLEDLKAKALSMGYSRQEIQDYVTSKSEKRRMRAKAEAYLAGKGVNGNNKSELCRFGSAEIKRGTAIGTLLR